MKQMNGCVMELTFIDHVYAVSLSAVLTVCCDCNMVSVVRQACTSFIADM